MIGPEQNTGGKHGSKTVLPLHRLHPHGVLHLQPHPREHRAALEANADVGSAQDTWAHGEFGAVMLWAWVGVVLWGGGGSGALWR